MKKELQNKINRRDFFKLAGTGTAVGAAALYGCSGKKENTDSESAALGEVPTDKMTYRTNPTTGDRVSLLGYGCMRWPTRKRSDGEGDEIDQEAVNELVDYAIAHGVNYFDTSPAYVQGLSERATGIALKRHPREKFFIATKLSNFNSTTQTREGSLAMYRNSFKELQVDYIDYMLLHSIGSGGMDALHARYLDNGMLDFLVEERKAGRIRNLGFSYHGDIEVFDYLLAHHDEYKWDFVQIQLNYVDWKHAKEMNDRNTDAEYLYNELSKRGIPAVIMEPLLGGRLSRLNDHLVGRLKQHRPQNSVASWAFRYAGSFPDVLTVLSGMTYMEHLQDNLRTYSPLEPCTEEELELLEDAAQRMLQYPTVPCNDCKYCMPCPYGLDIPAILLHYNRCVNEGNVPKSSQDENYREARRAFLVGYDRSVPKLRQASHCTGCNQCNPHCPQNIDIPKKLQEIDRFVEDLKQERI
ncbi:MAG: aldo/keto reductase [Bacteroides sp.]|nr:aldo/keto reductase [Bacteroides sp.]